MKTEIKQQTKVDVNWIDESKNAVQYKRTSDSERTNEFEAFKIAKKAIALNADLTAFKAALKDSVDKVIKVFLKENEMESMGEKWKGNFTFFNFDRTIKIEMNSNDQIVFDEQLLMGCKAKLNTFLDENVNTTSDIIKQLILGAFDNSKGKIDSKKVMNLLKYKGKVQNKLFGEAMDMLQSSIRVNGSKLYYKVAILQEDGSYEYVDLNFSNI